MTEKRLGKGLGSLIGPPQADRPLEEEIQIDRIQANPHQPRHRFETSQLEELKESIRLHGVLQPIMVRRKGDRFEIILGERRWRAAKAVGKQSIPAIVREDVDDAAMLELALVENLQRADLDAIERATAFRAMMVDLNLTQDQVAMLWTLIDEYVNNQSEPVARTHRRKIERDGIGKVHFAWMGPVDDARSFYFRVHGPSILIEYDNTGRDREVRDSNHIHSMFRDPSNDYGEDLLKRHYQSAPHGRN